LPHNNSVIIETRNLTKRFGGLTAVDDVSLSLYAGRLQSIIGPNGAGKTTFFNLLTGMFPPTSGEIFLDGEEITRLSPPDIFRRGVVRTFQLSSIFPALSVMQNVEIAAQGRYRTSNSPWGRLNRPREEIRGLCLDYLERFRLIQMKDQRADLLAYGEKRRLEIILSLVCDPKVLVLDEPTNGMSPEETEEMSQFIKGLSENITILLVEHDMKVVMGISDRVVVLHRGSVLADGTPQEIQSHPEVQAIYLKGSHAKGVVHERG
jgi:branched-chain amino acid transport system ATP-binding protein